MIHDTRDWFGNLDIWVIKGIGTNVLIEMIWIIDLVTCGYLERLDNVSNWWMET